MRKRESFQEIYRDGSGYRVFLTCLLITGLSYGLYKGMLDNYLAEIVGMGEMDRGITEFFRELPGIALVFILAAFYMLSAETLFKAGAVIMLLGMGMHAVLPASKVLATLAICTYSLGEHIQLGMKSQTLLMVGICPVFSLPSRAGIVLVLHILASVHILIARRQKESKPVIQQSVPISSRSDDVRQRTS